MDDPRITAIDQHHDTRSPAVHLSDLVATGPAYRPDHHALPDMPALRDMKPYRCGTCDKSFQKPTELTRHERSHSGARPFQCKTCQKCFLKASDLKRHDRIHTGERPYICPVCGRSFAEGGSLQRHSRMHTGERPYACSICHKQFVRSYNAKKHTKMHGTVVASVIITKNLVPAALPKQQPQREPAQATACDAIGVPTMPSLISPIREPTEMGSPSINTLVLEATNQSQPCNSASVSSITIPRPPTSVLDSFMHP